MDRLTILRRRLEGERRVRRTGGRRRSDREPNRGWRTVLAITGLVAAVDWLTKALITAAVPLGDFVEVLPGSIAFWHVRNDAMMLGLWDSFPLPVRKAIAVAAGVMAFFILFRIIGRGHRLPADRRPWAWVFVGLAFGGMLGNLGERVVHWGVTDYLSFRWGALWLPPGNVADIALFLSIPLALPVMLFELRARSLRGTGTPAADSSLPDAAPVPRT